MVADTIYALASPPGKSGVAVLRVSGSEAFSALQSLTGRSDFKPRYAYYCDLYDEAKAILDKALVLYFKGPASFTGEDVVEIYPHGSPSVLHALFKALEVLGDLRLAEPGEFTRRAFENGKLDLTEAEAVADLINAETQLQRIQALEQMDGALSGLYERWTHTLKEILAHLEADLEFPDEDLPEGILPQLKPKLERLALEVEDHLDDNRRGERLRDGLQVAIIGAPNAGKSSLLNKLAKRDVAIVSDMAGTTRDVIEVHLDIEGYPFTIADTAGLRPDQIDSDGQDVIEQEGIKRALARAQSADIRVLLFDGTQEAVHNHTVDLIHDASIVVVNKIDESVQLVFPEGLRIDPIAISAKTGDGLDNLISALKDMAQTMIGSRELPSLTRQRHRNNLQEALNCLQAVKEQQKMPELAAEDLRIAIRYLGRITGRVDVEDLLDVIFSDFCIGK